MCIRDSDSVAWRQKEQFSDGVGYSWIDTLKALTAEAVSDEQMAHATERFPINTPQNKDCLLYTSDRPQLLFNYFRQQFAQVTNPAIDPIRDCLLYTSRCV